MLSFERFSNLWSVKLVCHGLSWPLWLPSVVGRSEMNANLRVAVVCSDPSYLASGEPRHFEVIFILLAFFGVAVAVVAARARLEFVVCHKKTSDVFPFLSLWWLILVCYIVAYASLILFAMPCIRTR